MHLKSRDFEHVAIVSRNFTKVDYKSALKINENVSGKENLILRIIEDQRSYPFKSNHIFEESLNRKNILPNLCSIHFYFNI